MIAIGAIGSGSQDSQGLIEILAIVVLGVPAATGALGGVLAALFAGRRPSNWLARALVGLLVGALLGVGAGLACILLMNADVAAFLSFPFMAGGMGSVLVTLAGSKPKSGSEP